MEQRSPNHKIHSLGSRPSRSHNGAQPHSFLSRHVCVFIIVCFTAGLAQSEDCECGLAPTSRMYKGTPVNSSEYPWMCLLLTVSKDSITQCGSTLVSPDYVVTAGHCVPDSDDEESFVVCGASDPDSAYRLPDSEKNYVESFTYIDLKPGGMDIAVAKLEKPVNRMPACLPKKGSTTFEGAECKLLGYGQTENAQSSKSLLGGDVTIPSNEECKKIEPDVTDDEICAGNYNGEPAFCSGDSGGPLQCKDESGRWTLAGVISASWECADTTEYGICMRVTEFVDWIQEQTGNAACVI